jgi:hypothetical protein
MENMDDEDDTDNTIDEYGKTKQQLIEKDGRM